MKINSAELDMLNQTLVLHIENYAYAKEFLDSFKAGEYEIKRKSQGRSLDANRFMWAICRDISNALGNVTDVDVYKEAVKRTGIYKDFTETPDRAKTLMMAWQELGIGWVSDIVDWTEDGEQQIVRCWYGSSRYNSKQMKRLIDYLLEDARNMELPIANDQRIDSLIADWEAKHENK